MTRRNSGELPWIGKAFVFIIATIVTVALLNWSSDGELFRFAKLALSGDLSSGTSLPAPIAPVPEGQPSQEEINDAMAGSWDCYYEPTINDDWHDDVICRNGLDTLRPVLLPDSGFVTEDEMIAAGEAYEAQLNQ